MEDLQYKSQSGMFNVRVVGVCVKENKVFISKLKGDEFWTFVGGKAHFGESTADAVLREFEEEVGAKLSIDRLAAVIENFFEFQAKKWHQYIFCYILKDEENALEIFEGERAIKDNPRGVYKWVDVEVLKNEKIAPACLAEILGNSDKGIQHIIGKEF